MGDIENKVTIRTSIVDDGKGGVEPYMYYVLQNGLQHGFFSVNDYDSPEDAKAAAMKLADRLKMIAWVSPFEIHRDIIMADYGTAAKLRRIVLSLWNGHAHPVDLSDIAGMDKKHFGIVIDLMTSYHTLGENDKAFMKLAKEIFDEKERAEEVDGKAES